MDFSTLFSARGRIGRLTWFRLSLLFYLVGFIASALFASGSGLAVVISLVLFIVLLRAAVVSAIKRSQDHGWSWFWIIFLLIPIVGFVWFWLVPGQRGPNQYGDPESGSPFGRKTRPSAQFQKVTP